MGTRILVVGGGGREHALVWKLAQSSRVEAILCAPGNPGTADVAESLPIRVSDLEGLVRAAVEHRVDLVVPGPEEPLALGLADRLNEAGVPVCGPTAAATRLESSKAFAKEIMAEANVPTARSVVVRDLPAALTALSEFALPVVIKADGLAAGKGVVICESRDEARAALTAFLEDHLLGHAGATVVIEECLEGREVSIFALTDGVTVRTLSPARDHKRVADHDQGPNTGGMGAYAPVPDLSDVMTAEIERTILEPTVRTMASRGTPFRGVLYAGLMLTPDGMRVLEFNARFGDPETQVVLPLLDGDLAELLLAIARGTLADAPTPRSRQATAVGVVFASGGYPGPYTLGLPIMGLSAVPDDVIVFHAGTRQDDEGRIVTNGGRVLSVVGLGDDLVTARERAYAGADLISFPGAHFRRDIGLGAV